ncbi:hypothetical protein PRNP1_010947 [Phytophthora ramorum]
MTVPFAAAPPSPASHTNPLSSASLLSQLLVLWFQPLVSLGARRPLSGADLWPVCASDSSRVLQRRLSAVHEPLPMVAAFLRVFRRPLLLVFANYSFYLAAMALQAYVAQALLDFLNGRVNAFQIANGYALLALLAAVSIVAISCRNYAFFLSSRAGANMRSLVMTCVFHKSLRLSSAARQQFTTGEVLTLMSVDAERVFSAMMQGPWLVVAPLGFVVCLALIGLLFDAASALCGVAVLVVVLTLSICQAKRISAVQRQLLTVVDERVKVTSEALQGVRVIKLYAWERSIVHRVHKLRATEVSLFRTLHVYMVSNSVLLFLTPVFLSGSTLGLYVLLHGAISVTDAFTLVALVNICRAVVNEFTTALAALSQARSSFRRIDRFMASDEFRTPAILSQASDVGRIRLRNVHSEWPALSDAGTNGADGQIIGNGTYEEVVTQFPDLRYENKQADRSNILFAESELEETEADTDPTFAIAAVKEETVSGTTRLVEEEDRATGTVGGRIYRAYFDETGYNGVMVLVVLVVAYSVSQGMRVLVDWWQGHWASNMTRRGVDPTYSGTVFGMFYLAFIVACTVLTLGRSLMMTEACIRSAKNLHDELFQRVLSAPVNRYFDVTPTGRILNRFSNDLDQMDSVLPQQYQMMFQNVAMSVGSVVVSAVSSYWICVAYIPLVVMFVFTGQYFNKTSREVKRLEGVSRSPVYNLFGETLAGLQTIRAFKMQSTFAALSEKVVDENTAAYFSYCAAGSHEGRHLACSSGYFAHVLAHADIHDAKYCARS